MLPSVFRAFATGTLACSLISACATTEGSGEYTLDGTGYGGAADASAGTGGNANSAGSAAGGSSGSAGSQAGGTGGTGGSAGAGGAAAGGSGASGGSAGSAGSGGSGGSAGATAQDCLPTRTCQTATDLGVVNADDDGDPLTFSGSGSAWVVFEARESLSDLTGAHMYLQVDLTPPADEDFDLFVYMDTDSSSTEPCDLVPYRAEAAQGNGVAETVKVDWGEDWFANLGDDESRRVVVEVRAVSPVCRLDEQWYLGITGG